MIREKYLSFSKSVFFIPISGKALGKTLHLTLWNGFALTKKPSLFVYRKTTLALSLPMPMALACQYILTLKATLNLTQSLT